MKRRLYNRFIRPTASEPDVAARELVLNSLVLGVFALSLVALADTVVFFVLRHQPYLLGRIVGIGLTVLFILALYRLSRVRRYRPLVALFLVLLIALAGDFVAY